MEEKSIFETLKGVNVNGHTEKKNGLTYLSWPYAVSETMKRFPNATYEVVKQENGLPYTFDPNTGYLVNTRVTIGGVTREMWLPVMDGANKAMKNVPYAYEVYDPNFKYCKKGADGLYRDRYGNVHTEKVTKECKAATMFDINKAIMRCLVKNLAMFGLGLYIYAGEDLPEEDDAQQAAQDIPATPDDPAKPEAQQEDKSNWPCSTTELAVLEAMAMKTYKTDDIKKIFPAWPNITKAQYAQAMEVMKKGPEA